MTWIHRLEPCDSAGSSFKNYEVLSTYAARAGRKRNKRIWVKGGLYPEVSSSLDFSWGQGCEIERFLNVKWYSLHRALAQQKLFMAQQTVKAWGIFQSETIVSFHKSLSLSPRREHPPWCSGKPEALPFISGAATEKPPVTRYPSQTF